MTTQPKPKWIGKIYTDDTGEDFLGLRSVQANITSYLLPGIITITPRARYYSFYSWLLQEYQRQHPSGISLARFIKRREQIFALANLVFHEKGGYGEGTAGLIGTIKLSQILREIGDESTIPLSTDDYIAAGYGGYSQYSGVMRNLEITRDSDSEDIDLELLPKASLLANSFQEAVSESRYFIDRNTYDAATLISKDILMEYGEKCYLSGLYKANDCIPILNVLFGFDANYILPEPTSPVPTFGNMAASLGLILDMLEKSQEIFDDEIFRRYIMYGNCPDFPEYQPNSALKPVLSHWRMFQLREYYVYALYEFWIFFLDVMRTNGPFSYDDFQKYLNQVDLKTVFLSQKINLPKNRLSEVSLKNFINIILEQSNLDGRDFIEMCYSYTNKYLAKINEFEVQQQLDSGDLAREKRLMLAFLILISIYLRLKGIHNQDQNHSWHWAKEGGARRRSMSMFMLQIDEYLLEDKSLLQTFDWLFRDYIIAQHTITALEKWRQRKVNTFHFTNDNGVYEWIKTDGNTFTASRFVQAYAMIKDLGLANFNDNGIPSLSDDGQRAVKLVLEKIGGKA